MVILGSFCAIGNGFSREHEFLINCYTKKTEAFVLFAIYLAASLSGMDVF